MSTSNNIPTKSSIDDRITVIAEGQYVGRESREWWAATDYGVQKTRGYSCPQDMWWCPSVGFSGTVGHSLFETEALALDKKIKELDLLIDKQITMRRDLISRRELLNE